MRTCSRCGKETEEVFCPSCHSLTFPKVAREAAPTGPPGEVFECTVWQGPNRSRGIEVPPDTRDKHFSKAHDIVMLHIEGRRTVARLGSSFWKKPSVIRTSLSDDGRDQLLKFFEKHHLLPPDQSLKEKGIIDTIVFEVVVAQEEFKVSVSEKQEDKGEKDEEPEE